MKEKFLRAAKSIQQNKVKSLLICLLAILVFTGIFYNTKEMPAGINYQSAEYNIPVDKIEFLTDLTYEDKEGKRHYEQKIFDNVFSLIDGAEEYILIDMFLFNSFQAKPEASQYRDLANELTSRLIKKLQENPDIKIDFITDPINTVYGGAKSKQAELLQSAGVNMIFTDLFKLRDGNTIYSPLWRVFFQWFGNSISGGVLKNPFSYNEQKVTLRSYLSLLNFKANHRKLIIADSPAGITSIIMSANPHNGSSAHSNVAFKVVGDIGREIYIAEEAVANLSSRRLQGGKLKLAKNPEEESPNAQITYLTENKIKDEIISLLASVKQGDKIFLAMFYLSERNIIKSLISAAQREAEIKIILDPNKDAFGYEKIGIPNRMVAKELIAKSKGKIKVKWYNTNGEQYHSKMLFIEFSDGSSAAVLGSANLTRRNLNNYNLEADIKIRAEADAEAMKSIREYFEKVFNNTEGNYYTDDFSVWDENSKLKIIVYYLQEYLGLSSF